MVAMPTTSATPSPAALARAVADAEARIAVLRADFEAGPLAQAHAAWDAAVAARDDYLAVCGGI